MQMNMPYHGAKLALFVGDDLAVILRDDRDDIPWPNCWDMPGGGREGNETPMECALRETHEELGVQIEPSAVVWGKRFDSELGDKWFFAVHLLAEFAKRIQLGDEGQRWTLMSVQDYLEHPQTISHLGDRLRVYLSGDAGDLTRKPPAA
jgi:8-oxo-dGTP diphosphatase